MGDLVIKSSQYNHSEGGDISQSGGLFSDDRLDFVLTSEESFFSTDIYKGYYIQNLDEFSEARNIEIRVIGGTGKASDIDDALTDAYRDYAVDESAPMIDRSPSREVVSEDMVGWNPDLLTFYDFIYGRRLMSRPPYKVPWDEIDGMNTSYPDQGTKKSRQMFEDFRSWLRQNVIGTSPSRKSLFGQLNTEIYTPEYRILPRITDFTQDYPYGTVIKIPYLDKYTLKSKENYWGFYLKIETDFIPDWELDSDFSMLLITWDEHVGSAKPKKRKKLFKISVRGNMKAINQYNFKQVEELYSHYPTYFRYYDDESIPTNNPS